jgi:hypothetical protein
MSANIKEKRDRRFSRLGRSKSPPNSDSGKNSDGSKHTFGFGASGYTGFGASSMKKPQEIIDLTSSPGPAEKTTVKPPYFGGSFGGLFRGPSGAPGSFVPASGSDYRTVVGPYGSEYLPQSFTPAHPYHPPGFPNPYIPSYSNGHHGYHLPPGSSGAHSPVQMPTYPPQLVPPPYTHVPSPITPGPKGFQGSARDSPFNLQSKYRFHSSSCRQVFKKD